MAKGSEPFTWKLFPGSVKECWQCKRRPLRVMDVGEHRRMWPSQKTQFLCVACQRQNIQDAIRARRGFNGLPPATAASTAMEKE